MTKNSKPRLRSEAWWDDLIALYLERFPNHDLTREEPQSGQPIIGIAQTGSDFVPCKRRSHVHVEPLEKVHKALDHLLQGKVKGRTVWLVGLLSHI